MKGLSSLLLGSWLGSALAFDFEDLNDDFSPAFNLELSTHNHDSGFELQREPEPAFDIADQSPANSSLFITDLLADVDLWDDGDDDGKLLARQSKCPAGSYMCGNGKCCRTGQTCVTNGCCPSGNSQCGTRGCYNPGAGESCCGGTGRYCPKGYDCVSNGCCRKGTKPCGSGCYDPKTEVCCGVAGTCPKTSTCVTGGCCPKGMKKCGNSKCYDPTKETCCPANSGLCGRQSGSGACALDTVCPKGKTCVEGNGCCPEGHKLCGTKGCYDPKKETCCEDTGESCPKDYDCLKDGGCCPKGMIKCGKEKCYDPNKSVCCQDKSGSNNWGCQRGLQCCVASGGCFDSKTQRCCGGSRNCAMDESCCGGKCCPKGETCCAGKCCKGKKSETCCNGKCCSEGYTCDKSERKPWLRKCVPTETKTTKECETPTPTRDPPKSMVTIPFVYDPKRLVRDKTDKSKKTYFEMSNHAVLINMCRGMKKLNGGKVTQKIKLTYAGKDDDECWHKRNRDIMCPEGFCRDAYEEFVDRFFPDGVPKWAKKAVTAASDMQCDEFPFASTLQGGDLANGIAMCIPADQNGFQGGTMGKYFWESMAPDNIQAGEDFMIEIKGWDCDDDSHITSRRRDVAMGMFDDLDPVSFSALAKRDSFNDLIEQYGEEMYHGFDTDNPRSNLMTMPLGDLAAGTYLVNLDVKKGNLSYTLVDYVGNIFEATVLSNGSVRFTLEDDRNAVCLTGTTEEEEVELSYKAETLPDPVKTTEAPEPSETDNAGFMVQPRDAAKGMVIACAIVAFWN